MSQKRSLEKNGKFSRKRFLRAFAFGIGSTLILPLIGKLPLATQGRLRRFLRPPGSQAEKLFLRNCIACGQCANVCPNQCITLYGLEGGLENLGTPRISARAQACILCMACNQVCPTDALEKLEPTKEGMRAVQMGMAVVAEDLCYSFAGRTCGVCYRACPLPGEAMTVGLFEQPHVHPEHCIGCGLCEQACIKLPQAIRVIPRLELEQRDAEENPNVIAS